MGFDFSASLVEKANNNKACLLSKGHEGKSITFEVGNAKTYRLNSEPYVLFMFNPFGWDTMKHFLENNIDVLRKTKSWLLYANDVCVNDIAKYENISARATFFNLSVVNFGS